MSTPYSKLDSLCEKRMVCLSHESLGVYSVFPLLDAMSFENNDLSEILRKIEVVCKAPTN